jgi:PAS domain-containing protein
MVSNILHKTEQNAHSLEVALNAMPVGISWATLSDQKIVFMNRNVTEIFGYKMGDFKDIANWIEQTYPSPEDRALASEKRGASFAAPGDFEHAIDPIEYRIRCKDGAVKTIHSQTKKVASEGRAIACLSKLNRGKSGPP